MHVHKFVNGLSEKLERKNQKVKKNKRKYYNSKISAICLIIDRATGWGKRL